MNKDKFLTFFICLLGYFLVGISSTTIGVLLKSEADFFHVGVDCISIIYTLMNFGNLISIYFSGFL